MKSVKRRHLPSLSALATFEVAARHLSFTHAARELNVTQGAISQQMRSLEKSLGAPLFHRKHNALELTFAGSTLFSAVNAGLNIISGGINLLTPTAAPEITISATDALATYWLKPLIDSFRAEHPDVHFTVLASDDDPSLSQHSGVDIALLCGNERFEIGDALHLMYPEIGQPVCTLAFLREHGPFPDAESLTGVNLLHLHERHWSSGAIQWHPLGWEEWFEAQGVSWQKRGSSLSTNKVTLLTDACLAGEGVMLGIHNLVRNHIKAGRLVFAHPATIRSGRSNFLKLAPRSNEEPTIARFVEHLLEDLRGH